MDDPTAPLIAIYGHSSQELVNLLLAGTAVTNVFDGDRHVGGVDDMEEESANQVEKQHVGDGLKLR